ncbi:hypothetical protein GCM10010278_79930 [Streptomyces melanogenes]|nr:hypothetical protein GCM10010278_79930 [Streptomyces melanogenes]
MGGVAEGAFEVDRLGGGCDGRDQRCTCNCGAEHAIYVHARINGGAGEKARLVQGVPSESPERDGHGAQW